MFGLGLLIFGQIPCYFIYGISNGKSGMSVRVLIKNEESARYSKLTVL